MLPPAETHQLDPEQRARKPARIAFLCVGVAVLALVIGGLSYG
jgi:hypothetical protein